MFPEHPVIAFRRPCNLRDLLVNALVPQAIATDRLDTADAIAKCKGKNCDTCPRFLANRITHVTSHATGHICVLGCKNLGCKTANMIYLISCDICGKQ
jgi:hypothetical protein